MLGKTLQKGLAIVLSYLKKNMSIPPPRRMFGPLPNLRMLRKGKDITGKKIVSREH